MANGDKYKSKKQLKKEGLMEKGGVIPSSPSWKNRMHRLVDRFKVPAFVGTPPSSVDWPKDTVVPKRKRKDKKKKIYDGGTLPEVTITPNVPKRRVKKELKRTTKRVKK